MPVAASGCYCAIQIDGFLFVLMLFFSSSALSYADNVDNSVFLFLEIILTKTSAPSPRNRRKVRLFAVVMALNENSPVLKEYSAIVNDSLASFATVSRKIGGELPKMVDHVTRLFNAQRQFIQKAVQTKKPTNDQQIQELVKPQSTEIEAICGRMKLF